MYTLLTVFCMTMVITYVLANAGQIVRLKQYHFINLTAFLYYSSFMISKIFNKEVSLFVIAACFFRFSIFPFIELQRERGHITFLYKIFLLIMGVSLFFNDVLMVIFPGRFYGDGMYRNFFLGNKFSVGYDHMIFLILFCIVFGSSRYFSRLLAFLLMVTIAVCIYINCRTTILGTLAILAIYAAPEAVYQKLNSKKAVFILAVVCALFVFFVKAVEVPFIKYFITEILHRDLTLTGRLQIFEVIPKVIVRRPWLGYGSSSGIMSRYTGAYDAQNGFFDLAVSNGLPSAILYVVMIVSLVARKTGKAARLFLGGIYAFIIMSMVEVTYGTTLIFFGILLYTESEEYREQKFRLLEMNPSLSIRLL